MIFRSRASSPDDVEFPRMRKCSSEDSVRAQACRELLYANADLTPRPRFERSSDSQATLAKRIRSACFCR